MSTRLAFRAVSLGFGTHPPHKQGLATFHNNSQVQNFPLYEIQSKFCCVNAPGVISRAAPPLDEACTLLPTDCKDFLFRQPFVMVSAAIS